MSKKKEESKRRIFLNGVDVTDEPPVKKVRLQDQGIRLSEVLKAPKTVPPIKPKVP